MGTNIPTGFQLFADMGDGPRGFVAIHGHPNDFRPGPGQGRHLPDGRVDIGGIRVRHGLYDDRRAAADLNRPDLDADGTCDAAAKAEMSADVSWVIETVPSPKVPRLSTVRAPMFCPTRRVGSTTNSLKPSIDARAIVRPRNRFSTGSRPRRRRGGRYRRSQWKARSRHPPGFQYRPRFRPIASNRRDLAQGRNPP